MATFEFTVKDGNFDPAFIDALDGDTIVFVTDSDKTKIFTMVDGKHANVFTQQDGNGPVRAGNYTLAAPRPSYVTLTVDASDHGSAERPPGGGVNGGINVGTIPRTGG